MPPARSATLSSHLRVSTGAAHARLEAALDLLAEPLSHGLFRQALEGFYGFHRAWEPAMARHEAFGGAVAAAGRLATLRGDLLALGRSDAEIAALPVCPDAAGLAADPWAALGSHYVMEGSTLGGQVIARALAAAPWRPAAGLRYFDSYGAETGARWRAFKAWLDDAAPPEAWPMVANGAAATFDALAAWLARPRQG